MKSYAVVLVLIISFILPILGFYVGLEVVKSFASSPGPGMDYLIILAFTTLSLAISSLLFWGLKEGLLRLVHEPYKPINWQEVWTFGYWKNYIVFYICLMIATAFVVFIFLVP